MARHPNSQRNNTIIMWVRQRNRVRGEWMVIWIPILSKFVTDLEDKLPIFFWPKKFQRPPLVLIEWKECDLEMWQDNMRLRGVLLLFILSKMVGRLISQNIFPPNENLQNVFSWYSTFIYQSQIVKLYLVLSSRQWPSIRIWAIGKK